MFSNGGFHIVCTTTHSCSIFTILARDGKSVQNSTDENFSKKNSTKNAYFATYFNLRQTCVNSLEINQVAEY